MSGSFKVFANEEEEGYMQLKSILAQYPEFILCGIAGRPSFPDMEINKINDVHEPVTASTRGAAVFKYALLNKKISDVFMTVGIPAHIKGYTYLREAVKMTIEEPTIINGITKELYPSVAKVCKTSPSKVERAMRHAIEVGWARGKIENINTLFGVKVYGKNDRPTNSEFVALVADKLMIDMQMEDCRL